MARLGNERLAVAFAALFMTALLAVALDVRVAGFEGPEVIGANDSLNSPLASPGPCVGDCNGDGHVEINEIITCVNVALGTAAVSTCSACDPDNNGDVQINEIVQAVNNALNGCPVNPPSAVAHWDFYHTQTGGTEEGLDYLEITQSDSALTATFVCYGSERAMAATLSGNTLSIAHAPEFSATGTLSGDAIVGGTYASTHDGVTDTGTYRAVRGQQPTAKQCVVATTDVWCDRFPQNDEYWVEALIRDPDGLVSLATISGSYVVGSSPFVKDPYPDKPAGRWWTRPNIFISRAASPPFPLSYVVYVTFKDGTTTNVPRSVVSWAWAQ